MTDPAEPDCDRCDDTRLDPDAYIPHETEHGTAYMHAPSPATSTSSPSPHLPGRPHRSGPAPVTTPA